VNKIVKLKTVNLNDYYSVDEAAEKLKIKPNVVRNYLHLKKLTTFKFKGLTLISKKEVDERIR